MELLVEERLPMNVVALRCGVNRSTIWRWRQAWLEIKPKHQNG